jgi:two-component system, cell cycle response regulator
MHINNNSISAANYGADPDAMQSQPSSTRRACRVLVVDDDELERTRLSALLAASQFEVETAASGAEAMRVLNATHCNIVLTDWQMPDMDGLALCRRVRLRTHESYVYVLILTIRSAKDDMLTGLAAGADDYVVKGAAIEEILARLEIGRRISQNENSMRGSNRDNRGLSYADPITGAYTVAYLAQHLPRELARSQRYGHAVAVLNCEIDGFKEITEQYGDEVGDELLRAFVTRAESCIRNGDWLARTGDAEFMLVLPETPLKGAHRAAQKLQQLFALHPLSTPFGPIAFTSSIEVTAIDARRDAHSAQQIHALLRTADRRMVAFKRHDGNMEDIDAMDGEAEASERPARKNGLN